MSKSRNCMLQIFIVKYCHICFYWIGLESVCTKVINTTVRGKHCTVCCWVKGLAGYLFLQLIHHTIGHRH